MKVANIKKPTTEQFKVTQKQCKNIQHWIIWCSKVTSTATAQFQLLFAQTKQLAFDVYMLIAAELEDSTDLFWALSL